MKCGTWIIKPEIYKSEICNLQTDDSGVARPAARETKVEGSIAVPMLLNGTLYGTFGIAKPVAYDFTKEERAVFSDMIKKNKL